jgi:predicted pyridoxine 5'-phosphate oxidase superfamily flavin-nucleotide-binding protein
VDYTGNKQYISAGNLSENPKAQLFLMDYENRQRVKIWGEAQIVEGDEALTAKLTSAGYEAKPEQVIVFTVKAWDANCPQHIPVRLDAEKMKSALDQRDQRIQVLEARLAQLGQDVRGM